MENYIDIKQGLRVTYRSDDPTLLELGKFNIALHRCINAYALSRLPNLPVEMHQTRWGFKFDGEPNLKRIFLLRSFWFNPGSVR